MLDPAYDMVQFSHLGTNCSYQLRVYDIHFWAVDNRAASRSADLCQSLDVKMSAFLESLLSALFQD